MKAAGFEYNRRLKLWREAASTATRMSNIIVTKPTKKSPHKRFFGIKPKIMNNLRTVSKLVIVTASTEPKIKCKIEDQGILCMLLGYSVGYDGKNYRMLNLKKRKVWLTRDFKWLHKFYAQKKGIPSHKFILEFKNQVIANQENERHDNQQDLLKVKEIQDEE